MYNHKMNYSSPMRCGCDCGHLHASNAEINSDNAPISALFGPGEASLLITDLEWGDGNGTGSHVTFSFPETTPSYYPRGYEEYDGFQSFLPNMQNAARSAFTLLETFTNLTFSEESGSAGDITFGQAVLTPDAVAWAYYPDQGDVGGDVWMNTQYAHINEDVSLGGEGYRILLHEIGHALGLDHTFEVGITGFTDTEQYSVMSYDDTPWGGVSAQSYMLYDIAALQQIYGANTDYNAGRNIYKLDADAAYTIWDGGGIDMLDGRHLSSDLTLRLTAGEFSSANAGITDHFAIAYGTTIENAYGGTGDDLIIGNDVANRLQGGAGDDTLLGAGGDDILVGEAGADNLDGEAGNDRLYGGDGDDTLAGGTGNDLLLGNDDSDTLYGDNGDDHLYGGKGDDTIYGGDDNDRLFGETGVDILYGEAGNDRLYAAHGNDTLYGDDGDDLIYGQQDNDTLHGGAGNDRLYGGSGDNTLNGDAGNDLLVGDSGIDILNGGDGVDRLFGRAGDDVLHGNNHNDLLIAQDGDDVLYGDDGLDRLYGGNDNDTLYGGADNDLLLGQNGNDTLYGEDGDDRLYAGSGQDMLYGGADNDTLYGGDGIDTISGGTGNDRMNGYDGNDILSGNEGNDVLVGGNNNDVLRGGSGNDTLYGGADDDILIGGSGIDKLSGDAGIDVIGFSADEDSVDHIYNFDIAQDAINITDVLSGYDSATDDIADFVSVVHTGTRFEIEVDRDGGGDNFNTIAKVYTDIDNAISAQDLLDSNVLITTQTLI